jgi:hypothetical protein
LILRSPDPGSGGGIQIPDNSGINPQSPAFQSAQGACFTDPTVSPPSAPTSSTVRAGARAPDDRGVEQDADSESGGEDLHVGVGRRRERGELAGQAHPGTRGVAITDDVVSEHARLSRIRSQQRGEHADRRCLAGAVPAQ